MSVFENKRRLDFDWHDGELTVSIHRCDPNATLDPDLVPARKIQSPLTGYDPWRFTAAASCSMDVIVARANQLIMYDTHRSRLVCMFCIRGGRWVAWMPDGTRYGPRDLLGAPVHLPGHWHELPRHCEKLLNRELFSRISSKHRWPLCLRTSTANEGGYRQCEQAAQPKPGSYLGQVRVDGVGWIDHVQRAHNDARGPEHRRPSGPPGEQEHRADEGERVRQPSQHAELEFDADEGERVRQP